MTICFQAERPTWVAPPEFQYCLNYTLLAKLAPAWNKVGEYLVQGKYDLKSVNTVAMLFE